MNPFLALGCFLTQQKVLKLLSHCVSPAQSSEIGIEAFGIAVWNSRTAGMEKGFGPISAGVL